MTKGLQDDIQLYRTLCDTQAMQEVKHPCGLFFHQLDDIFILQHMVLAHLLWIVFHR